MGPCAHGLNFLIINCVWLSYSAALQAVDYKKITFQPPRQPMQNLRKTNFIQCGCVTARGQKAYTQNFFELRDCLRQACGSIKIAFGKLVMGGVAPEATPPTRRCQQESQLCDLAAQWSPDSLPLTSLLSLTTTTMKSWNFTTFL